MTSKQIINWIPNCICQPVLCTAKSIQNWDITSYLFVFLGATNHYIDGNTNSICAKRCRADFPDNIDVYASTQLNNCFCSIKPPTKRQTIGQCSMPCPGDENQKCGALDSKVSVFRANSIGKNNYIYFIFIQKWNIYDVPRKAVRAAACCWRLFILYIHICDAHKSRV